MTDVTKTSKPPSLHLVKEGEVPAEAAPEKAAPREEALPERGAQDAYVRPPEETSAFAKRPLERMGERRFGAGFAEMFAQEVAEADDWYQRIADIDEQLRTLTGAFDPAAISRLAAMTFAARMTPRYGPVLRDVPRIPEVEPRPARSLSSPQALLVARLTREGMPDIKVPTLTALLIGEIPLPPDGRTFFGETLVRIKDAWYGGSFLKLGIAIRTDAKTLREIVSGKGRFDSFEKIVEVAGMLGVDPNLLSIPWFADINRPLITRSIVRDLTTQDAAILRAQMLVNMATKRMACEASWFVRNDFNLTKAMMLCFWCMSAGIHPKTAIPVIAAAAQGEKKFFDGVETFAQELADRGQRWDAAVACLLAYHRAEMDGDLLGLLAMVWKANSYLSGARAPEYISGKTAHLLRRHYLGRGLEYYNRFNEMVEQTSLKGLDLVPPGIIEDMKVALEELHQQGAVLQAGGALETGGDRHEGNLEGIAGFSASRWWLLDQLKRTAPRLYRAINSKGRWDIIHKAMGVAAATRSGFVGFHASVDDMAVREGLIGANRVRVVNEGKGAAAYETYVIADDVRLEVRPPDDAQGDEGVSPDDLAAETGEALVPMRALAARHPRVLR